MRGICNFITGSLSRRSTRWITREFKSIFPLDETVSRMLRMFGQLLGLVFVELRDDQERGRASPTGKAEDIFWHGPVMLYTVWDYDTQGEFVGYLYLDLHPLLGKAGKARCATIRSGFRYPDGTRCYPATCLVADFSPPTGTQPCLLRYREIVTLFHELGHCMHDLVSRTTYAIPWRFSGSRLYRSAIPDVGELVPGSVLLGRFVVSFRDGRTDSARHARGLDRCQS